MLPEDSRPPRPRKGGEATKKERERIDTINALARTFGVDVYLWFMESGKLYRSSKPFYLTWRASRRHITHKKFYARIHDAENAAHKLITSLPPID